uniref:Mitochondrial protein n=1 Tax=Lactuca sativa TaxID=4236 RepID=A0A9R1XPP8_LACSA|nr:hypothetical protein LSAT_V11C200098470 [Lactuca sativa]
MRLEVLCDAYWHPYHLSQILTWFLESEPLSDPIAYRQLVSSIVHLVVMHPNLAYAVYTISQFMVSYFSNHYAAILWILRYLRSTILHGIHFLVFSYTDLDGDLADRQFITSSYFFLGDSLISWRSKKHNLTAHLSIESKYRVLPDTNQELVWLRWILADVGTHLSIPTSLWCNNNIVIHIDHNDVFHKRTKHIEIAYFLEIIFCHVHEMTAH